MYCSVLQCVAVCYSVLQCVAVCCSALHCVAVCCSHHMCENKRVLRDDVKSIEYICMFMCLHVSICDFS